jgi:hypothetical protein
MTSVEPLAGADLSNMERRLEARFCPPLLPTDVNRCVVEALGLFDSAPVRTFVPILAERLAADRLRALVTTARRPR